MRHPPSSKEAARELAGTTSGIEKHQERKPILIGEQEAARILGISPRKLWGLRKKNAVPWVPIDRRVMYPTMGLDAWIKAGCPTEPNAADRLDWEGGAA